jgi:hypothetical protein
MHFLSVSTFSGTKLDHKLRSSYICETTVVNGGLLLFVAPCVLQYVEVVKNY